MTATQDLAAAAGIVRPAAVQVHGARKAFGANVVLDGIELTVCPGTVTVIIGPSGSGKSTLLRAINHLERLDQGYVSVGGEPIGVRRHGDRLKELPERAILAQRTQIGFDVWSMAGPRVGLHSPRPQRHDVADCRGGRASERHGLAVLLGDVVRVDRQRGHEALMAEPLRDLHVVRSGGQGLSTAYVWRRPCSQTRRVPVFVSVAGRTAARAGRK
jgi:energy-coupling factor transporter ATP-binding protein EcfA2